MDRRHAAGALLALAVCIASSNAAPTSSNQTSLDLYDGAAEGCYYNFQHYGEGDRIMTNEPCLNCTCHNRMLMCYLRVCPFTKPIGQDCTVEKRADQCCPIVTCPDVPVDLLTSTSTTSPAEYGSTGVGKLDKYGCSIEGKYFPEGSKVPPTPNKPCEHCYCIRNMTTCVMQECTLHVDGCTPIYHKDVCCPVRYSCDHDEDEVLLLDDMTTTVRPTPGFLLTTTTISPVTQMSQDCVHDDQIVPDGALIKTEKACEHCYCMKGDIVCVVQECGTPMENEGKNCTSQPPREGQCCPDTYICEGDEVTTDLPADISTQPSSLDDLTTLSSSRRPEGSDYRKETDEPYTEKSPLPTELEGSGYDQTTISTFDSPIGVTNYEEGSGFERSTLPPVSLTDISIPEKDDTEKEYETPTTIEAADKETTILHEYSTQSVPVHDITTEKRENEIEPTTDSVIKDIADSTLDTYDTKITEQGDSDYARTTTPRSDIVDTDVITTIRYDSEHKDSVTPTIDISDKETTEKKESGYEPTTTAKSTDIEKTTAEVQDSEIAHTIAPSTGVEVEEITEGKIDESPTTSGISDYDSTTKKVEEITTPTIIGVSDEKTAEQHSEVYEEKTTPSIRPDEVSTTEKQDIDYEKTSTPAIEVSDNETTEQKESDIEHTTSYETGVTSDVISEKYDLPTEHIDETSTPQSDYEVKTTPKIKLEDEHATEKDDVKYEQTTLSTEDNEQSQEKGDEKTTPPTFISDDHKTTSQETGLETTISPIDDDEDITKKQDIDYGSTTLPSSDFVVKDKEEQDSKDEKTTVASITVSSKDETEDVDIKISGEPDQKETTLQNISPSDEPTTQKRVSEFEHTTLAYTEIPDKVTEDKQHGYDDTTSSITIPDVSAPEKEREESTTHKQDTQEDKETTSSSTDDSYKDTSRPSEKEDESTTLSSTSIFEKETTDTTHTKDESTTLASIDLSTKEATQKDESTTRLYEKDDSIKTILPTDISEKEVSQTHVSEDEKTTPSSITDISSEDVTDKHDIESDLTTISSSPTLQEESDYDRTTVPTTDTSSDTKHELSSTLGVSDAEVTEKQSTEATKETTDESLLYITSTAKIPTLEDVEMTTEPDKDLNTVPHEIIYEDDSKLITTEKTDVVKEPTHSTDDKEIITIAPTIPVLDEETVPVDQTSISETHTPSIDENEVKDITTETSYKPIVETPEDIANQVKNYSRIPGEGDCLLNSITYKNNSEVPKSNNCHTSCKCISSIIKCDPILCSPPPKYMDNCQPIYETPDACCPTYICQTRETMPPQPDSHISVTEKPSSSAKDDCDGKECDVSHDKEVTSEKPLIDECGPSGCDVRPQPSECANGECSSHIPSAQPCEGNDCNIEPIITPIKNIPLCQDGQACQPQSKPCEGADCVNIDVTNVVSPPKGDGCKDNKDCHKQEDDISTQCTDESCRRKDGGLSDSQPPIVCSGSECIQYKPDSEVIPSTVSSVQEDTETKTDRVPVKPEIQTKSPETVPDELKTTTIKPEISNELFTSETKPSSEVTETSDFITTPSQDVTITEKSDVVTQHTTLETDIMTTNPTEILVTLSTEAKEPTGVTDTEQEGEVTKSPDMFKETVMTEQSVTQSPDFSTTRSEETNKIDDLTYVTKSPAAEHPTEIESFVTESQDITTIFYDGEHISTEIPKVTTEEQSTTEELLEISTEKLLPQVTESQYGLTTKKEDDQSVEITTTSQIEIEDEVSDVTTETTTENKDATVHIDDNLSIEKATTEPNKDITQSVLDTSKDSEFEIKTTSTETTKIEISTQETDLKTDSDLLVTPTSTDDGKIEEKPGVDTSTLIPITEEMADTKTTKPLQETVTPKTEKQEEQSVMETSEPIVPVTSKTDYQTTVSVLTEQTKKPQTDAEYTTKDKIETEISTLDITQSSVSDITESSVSDITKPSEADITELPEPEEKEPSVSDKKEPSVTDITKPSESDITETPKSDITEPSVYDITESSISDVTESSVSDITKSSESDSTKQDVPKLTETSISEEEKTTVNPLATDVDEGKTTEKTIETTVEDVTPQETISETQPGEISKPLPDMSEPTETSPVTEIVTTAKPATEYEETSTQDVSTSTEQKHDIPVHVETTTSSQTTLRDTELPTESNEIISDGEKTHEVDSNQYTTMPDVSYTEKQDLPTKLQDVVEPETVTQSLQTESPTVNIGPEIAHTEASLLDRTEDLISQTTKSHEYSTIKPETSELVTQAHGNRTEQYGDEEKYTTVIITDKDEMPITESSKLDSNIHETHATESSTMLTGEAVTTQFDITTETEVKIKETVPDITTEDTLATHIPEPHKKDQTDDAKVTEIDTSVTQAEPIESSHDMSSKLPQEATMHTPQENIIEMSTLSDKFATDAIAELTEATFDSTTKEDQEITKEPVEGTTVQDTYKVTTGPKDIVTENIPEITTTATEKLHDDDNSMMITEDTLSELPTETNKDTKETTTEESFDTQTEHIQDTTQKPQEVVTESIYDITTTVSGEIPESDVKITTSDVTPEKTVPESTISPTKVDSDSLLEITTEKQDITTVSSHEEVAEVDKEPHTKLSEPTTESLLEEGDSSESSQEPARTTEPTIVTETTPYVVELQEHPHIIHEVSTVIPAELESTTSVPDTKDEVTPEKDYTYPEVPSSPPTYDISTTLSNEIIEKSTESSLSTEKLETQPTPKTPDTSEDKHDIEVSSPVYAESTPETDHPIEVTESVIPVQTEKAPVTETPQEATEKTEAEITTTPTKAKPTKPSELLPPTKTPTTLKPEIEDDLPTEETPDENQFPSYSPDLPDYGEEPFGPGTCRYGGKVYVSAQQIPRDDPCDFCFCFRSDIICLQQSCPPPIHGCYEEPIQGFCCPRYECPVAMATTLNVTTTTTTTTTTLPPHFLPHAYKGAAQKRGCVIKGHTYRVGEVVRASSGPCLHCTCGGDGQMKCDPKACTPEPMLRQMIAAAVSAKRRR